MCGIERAMQAYTLSLLSDTPTNLNALHMPVAQASVTCKYSAVLMSCPNVMVTVMAHSQLLYRTSE
jgi:hypothetical protein